MDKIRQYGMIDIMKFICAFLVLSLHVLGYGFENSVGQTSETPSSASDGNIILNFVMPFGLTFARVAVPFFFLSSAFFLFKKLSENPDSKKEIMKKYCIRMAILYLVWQAISLPYMIDRYFFDSSNNFTNPGLIFALRLLLLNGFDGSWYIPASLFGALFVYLLSKKLSNKQLLIFSSVLYLIPCILGSYGGAFGGASFQAFLDNVALVISPSRTVCSSMIFFSLGKIFAEKDISIKKSKAIILLVVFMVLSLGELLLISNFGMYKENDYFFMLVPYSFMLFYLVLNANVQTKKIHIFLRKSSTFIYLLQFSLLYAIYRMASAFGWTAFYTVPVVLAVYFGIAIISVLVYWGISKIEKKKGFGFLKYCY